jgi:formate C-acetyltransferase
MLISNPPGICPERARYYTQAYQEYKQFPPIIKRAKALKSYLENKTLYLGKNDLLPGIGASHPRWASVFPEYSWRWVYDELDRFEQRRYDKFTISPDTVEELREVLPWWDGESLLDRIETRQPEYVKDATKIGVTSWTGQATSGEGHIIIDHSMVLKNGFEALSQRSATLKEALPLYEPESLNKRDFYEAVEIVCSGVLNYTERLAQEAERQAKAVDDEKRRQELTQIASDLRVVPAKPAQNFRQALMTVWLLHLIEQIESNGHSVSLGRLDQYLYPYLKTDLESGALTEDDALELLEHFYLKLFTIIKLRPEKHSRTQSGYPMYQNLVVGGQLNDGEDAVNPLSWLCLSALAEVRLSEPNFYIRLHPTIDEAFLQEALKVVRLGFGMPAFVNDEIIVPSLEGRGVSHGDALNYSTMGCLEVQVPGKWGYRANGKSKVNVLKVLELTLNGGRDPKTGINLSPLPGDITQMATFEDLMDAWNQQIQYYTKVHVTADNINDWTLEQLTPNAYCSLLVNDCLERGKHLNQGGAIYDMTSGALVGVPNVGNALAALKKLVYEDEVLTQEEVKQAIDSNFEGERGEEIRQILMNKVPKYGEDEDYVDDLTAEALNSYCDIIPEFKNMRYGRGPIGGNFYPSTVTISANITAGDVIGATPDGRKKSEPTADGISPSQGNGRKGPTAIFHSVAKLPTLKVTGGQLLNIRLTPDSLSTEVGVKKLSAMLRGFVDMKGWHVQFNTVSTEILRDAMVHPENYKDLIVRVAGYSALFVALDPGLQRDIIERMEHAL